RHRDRRGEPLREPDRVDLRVFAEVDQAPEEVLAAIVGPGTGDDADAVADLHAPIVAVPGSEFGVGSLILPAKPRTQNFEPSNRAGLFSKRSFCCRLSADRWSRRRGYGSARSSARW